MTTPIYDLPELDQNQASPNAYLLHNLALRYLEAVNTTAIGVINNPPSSPNDGDLYIVDSAPTGIFAGKANNLAMFFGGWYFVSPSSRMAPLYVESSSSFKIYNGSTWVDTSVGSSGVAVEENGVIKGSVESLNFVGSTVSVTGNEATVTVASGSSYTDEQVQDAIAPMFTGGSHSGISFAYDDNTNKINATVTGGGGGSSLLGNQVTLQLQADYAGDRSIFQNYVRESGTIARNNGAYVFTGNGSITALMSPISSSVLWTFEATFKVTGAFSTIWANTSSPAAEYKLQCYIDNNMGLRINNGYAENIFSPPGTVSLNTTYRFALSWDGATLYVFLNGNLIASSSTQSFSFLGRINIIGSTSKSDFPYLFKGEISEIRISNWCRYTANHTPPSTPFPLP